MNNQRKNTTLVVVLGLLVLVVSDASAQRQPFMPGVVTSDAGESWVTAHPDGGLIVFGRHAPNWSRHTLYFTRRSGGTWSEPQVLPFSGSDNDRGARFSPDGTRLFFSSDRAGGMGGFDIWSVTYVDGGWGQPEPVPSPVSSEAHDIHPSPAADGSIYLASNRAASRGRSDLFVARPRSGGGYTVEHITDERINTQLSEPDVFVDPEQRFIVFARTDDPSGYGGDDLYISYRRNGAWTEPSNLGELVNSPEYEYGPQVIAGDPTLYFTTHRERGRQANIVGVPLSELGIEMR